MALEPKLRRLQQGLAPDLPGVRWVDPTSLHITLAFLGDVPHADLTAVCRAVVEAAEGVAPFDLELSGVGVFPGVERPRVLWAGVVGTGLPAVGALQSRVAGAVAGLGFPPDKQAFHPHVTIGRFDAGRGRGKGRKGPPEGGGGGAPTLDLSYLIGRRRDWTAGPYTVSEAVVYASTLTRDGPVYDPIARAPLKAPGA